MKTVLVTGCAGFIGWKVAGSLLDQNINVVGIDNTAQRMEALKSDA
jgi:UDP-glucuronate 4-epimerase